MDIDTPHQGAGEATRKDIADTPSKKLDRRQKKSKVHKRPINRYQVLTHGTVASSSSGSTATNPKQAIIYVGTKSPFMGIVTRVRKALNNGPTGVRSNSAGKGLTLAARIAELHSYSSVDQDKVIHEVLVRGTGRAMAKTLNIAAHFQSQLDTRINIRTMTLEAVDDVVVDDDGAEDEGGFVAEEDTRIRMVNCVEVGVSLR